MNEVYGYVMYAIGCAAGLGVGFFWWGKPLRNIRRILDEFERSHGIRR